MFVIWKVNIFLKCQIVHANISTNHQFDQTNKLLFTIFFTSNVCSTSKVQTMEEQIKKQILTCENATKGSIYSLDKEQQQQKNNYSYESSISKFELDNNLACRAVNMFECSDNKTEEKTNSNQSIETRFSLFK